MGITTNIILRDAIEYIICMQNLIIYIYTVDTHFILLLLLLLFWFFQSKSFIPYECSDCRIYYLKKRYITFPVYKFQIMMRIWWNQRVLWCVRVLIRSRCFHRILLIHFCFILCMDIIHRQTIVFFNSRNNLRKRSNELSGLFRRPSTHLYSWLSAERNVLEINTPWRWGKFHANTNKFENIPVNYLKYEVWNLILRWSHIAGQLKFDVSI